MKVFLSLFSLFFSLTTLFSQIRVVNDPNLSNYPEIDFRIYNRNPNSIYVNSLSFNQLYNDKKTLIDSVKIYSVNDTIDYSKKNKSVLILIETLGHPDRYEQLNTSLKAINSSLSRFIKKGDKVKLVWFALRNAETKILNDINPKFTDSINEIKSYLNEFRLPDNDFTNKYVSEITGALIEGVDI